MRSVIVPGRLLCLRSTEVTLFVACDSRPASIAKGRSLESMSSELEAGLPKSCL